LSQQTQNLMKKIFLNKVVLNMGVGKSGDPIETGKKTLVQITGKKPNARNAKKAQRDWGVRKDEPKDNQISERAFDNEGNFSFGIKEHIDIPGVKYDPNIGILGLEVSASLARPGFNIKLRSKHKARVGKNHRITKDDAIKFYTEKFGVQIV